MNAIAARIVAGLAAILVAFGAWQYVRALRGELELAQTNARQAKDELGTRDATIARMQREADAHARQLAQLEGKRQSIAADLAARESDIEALKNENATVRAWADGPLPDDVVRLYAFPAQTGADAPGAVPADHRMHDAGELVAH
jgi:LysB family phage lysis regulatory protein